MEFINEISGAGKANILNQAIDRKNGRRERVQWNHSRRRDKRFVSP
ncbi:MAG: hypothetical protein FWH27_15190 [Planctomycetaceae bacterium]|nr:hypothetical protein [Planctomycetaceae bacterium]